MSWITEIFTSSVGTVIDSVGKIVDNLHTSDEEKLKAKQELLTIQAGMELKAQELELQYEQEVSKRWVSDNEHIITRLTRPAIVVWSFTLLTIVMLLDGNIGEFNIKNAYIPLLETIVVSSVVAYMGSRGFEKSVKIYKGKQ